MEVLIFMDGKNRSTLNPRIVEKPDIFTSNRTKISPELMEYLAVSTAAM